MTSTTTANLKQLVEGHDTYIDRDFSLLFAGTGSASPLSSVPPLAAAAGRVSGLLAF